MSQLSLADPWFPKRCANLLFGTFSRKPHEKRRHFDPGGVREIARAYRSPQIHQWPFSKTPSRKNLPWMPEPPKRKSLIVFCFTLLAAQPEIIPSSICQKVQPKGEGHICYWLGSESGTWAKAQAQCEQDGGSLARISDLIDNMHVVELLNEKDVTQAWIGLKESFSSWHWLSGKFISSFKRVKSSRTCWRWEHVCDCFD